MDRFFTYMRKGVVATMIVFFAFVATYIPQTFNEVPEVEAGGLGNIATETTQWINRYFLGGNVANTGVSAGANVSTAFSTGSIWVKENILDGIGWAIAKAVVSRMVADLIDWINSGFNGRPAFVSDFRGLLIDAANVAIGDQISRLGDFGSFICSPFRLDVQLSLSFTWAQVQSNPSGAPTCTLTGIIDNIEGFIQGSFDEGGWDDWLDITSQPHVYTPYGTILTAQDTVRARIINAQGEERTLTNWGDGFLSSKICELVEGGRPDCTISKPGKVVQEALSFNLDSGRQTLITADEINEFIAALLGQLANQAISGAAGLLGLSGGNDYSYSGYDAGSYLDQLGEDSLVIIDNQATIDIVNDRLAVQIEYRALAEEYLPRLLSFAQNPFNDRRSRDRASSSAIQAQEIIEDTTESITNLRIIVAELEDPALTDERRFDLLNEYSRMRLYSDADVDASRLAWETALD